MVNKIDDFPLILNIIVKPGFNDKILCEHGYDNAFYYFSGDVDEEGACFGKTTDQIQGGKAKQQNIFQVSGFIVLVCDDHAIFFLFNSLIKIWGYC